MWPRPNHGRIVRVAEKDNEENYDRIASPPTNKSLQPDGRSERQPVFIPAVCGGVARSAPPRVWRPSVMTQGSGMYRNAYAGAKKYKAGISPPVRRVSRQATGGSRGGVVTVSHLRHWSPCRARRGVGT
ncbi:hypothetical protein GWK47_016075 [Chionoecetes opilio]|uniref:Uncharacterized protein n=1 Tax=Chionoecetes opilio TaxID=41210 RepID=A0A8J4Y200_CHIOP|nr:hypothetical protein GWK47_016075 [Chionoecetes opilio]